MHGSKIQPKTVYAIKHGDDLARFYVHTVTIVKTGPHPSDHKTSVRGYVVGGPAELITLGPKVLLGPYEEHAALVAAKKAEDDALKAKAASVKAEQERVWKRLYELTGTPMPQRDPRSHYETYLGDVFRRSFKCFDVSPEGADILIAALERAQAK